MRTYHDFFFKKKDANAAPASSQRRDRITVVMIIILAIFGSLSLISGGVHSWKERREQKNAERALRDVLGTDAGRLRCRIQADDVIDDIEFVSAQETYIGSLNDSILKVAEARNIAVKIMDDLLSMSDNELNHVQKEVPDYLTENADPQVDSLVGVACSRISELIGDIPRTGVEVFRYRLSETRDKTLAVNASALPKKCMGYLFKCRFKSGAVVTLLVKHEPGSWVEDNYCIENVDLTGDILG